MRAYPSLPLPILEGWTSSTEVHPAMEKVGFHYHDVEEWLEVLRGSITFFTLSGRASPLSVGSVFQIPRGEVHRAEIGAEGVEYRMRLPVAIAEGFANRLSADEVEMLQTNLEFPIREDNKDGKAAEFFAAHLSPALAFCRADATVAGADAFRDGFVDRSRSSWGTVRILNRKPNGILLSLVVTTGTGGASPQHFTNIRLFAKEGGIWKCRMWVNYPSHTTEPSGLK
jgi:hypothetical protein